VKASTSGSAVATRRSARQAGRPRATSRATSTGREVEERGDAAGDVRRAGGDGEGHAAEREGHEKDHRREQDRQQAPDDDPADPEVVVVEIRPSLGIGREDQRRDHVEAADDDEDADEHQQVERHVAVQLVEAEPERELRQQDEEGEERHQPADPDALGRYRGQAELQAAGADHAAEHLAHREAEKQAEQAHDQVEGGHRGLPCGRARQASYTIPRRSEPACAAARLGV
jgi:hypothetical protein